MLPNFGDVAGSFRFFRLNEVLFLKPTMNTRSRFCGTQGWLEITRC